MTFPERAPKAAGSFDRTVPLAATLALVPHLRARYGITRIAETTLLDRTNIPTYSAFVPKSPDLLGVYNGKGATREAAIASAVCEAAERQIGAFVQLPSKTVDLDRVRETLDLVGLGVPAQRSGAVECVDGYDVLAQRVVPVPLALVQCPWFGPPLATVVSSNGLASGNTLLEAAFHALCEIFERHVWSMHHVRSVWVPRLYRGMNAPEAPACHELSLPAGDAQLDSLVQRIVAVGLRVRVFVYAEPHLLPAALAHVWEPGSEPPMSHVGMGYGLAPVHAVIRALTEAVQSRVTDIQGAREDISRSDADSPRGSHTRRLSCLPQGRWFYDGAPSTISCDELADLSSDDLAADWRTLLSCARAADFKPVVVDITPRGESLHVVRALVPGAETAVLGFGMGERARHLFNPFGPPASPGVFPERQESA